VLRDISQTLSEVQTLASAGIVDLDVYTQVLERLSGGS
jgi:hypothetical protein